MSEIGFGTKAIHAGQSPDKETGAVMTPIVQSSTFAQSSPGKGSGYVYSRSDNPTRKAYEDCVAALENGQHGLAFSSGVAAIDACLHLLRSGDHLICTDDVYGGTVRLINQVYQQHGLEVSYVDFNDLDAVEKAFKDNTRMIFIESPSNPLLKVVDIKRLSELAKKNQALSVVDNTFATPYFQQPLQLGADIVLHSVTKYMNGHSDVVGGVTITQDSELQDRLKLVQKSVGAVPSPFDCFLAMRGLKTLHVRMERHTTNAQKLAEFLEAHPKVEKVLYPGLKSHPDHELAKKQMSGFSGMITFFIKGGLDQARSFLEKVKVFTLAESLGGVESLVEHPAIMTHSSVPKEQREQVGISDNLVRISVGIEDLEDLKADLDQALN